MRLAPAQPSRIAPHGRTAIANYSADAGAGSQLITNLSESPGWRAALLGTVAAGSLWLYSGRSARAACAPNGPTILNCTDTIAGNVAPGVVNGGILVPDTYTTLNVYDLDADIAPDTGVDGIHFHRTGAGNNVVINSDTRPFDIVVNGVGADGIEAMSQSAIAIIHTGDIDASAGRFGIYSQLYAPATGPLSIISNGTVTGGLAGIIARNFGTGAVSVVTNGEVTAIGSFGIFAVSSGVDVGTGVSLSITSEGVTAAYRGIDARNYGAGALEITANGDVEGKTSHGIFARQDNGASGSVSITTEGTVIGYVTGILARNYGAGALSIIANGDVEGTTGVGIFGLSDGVDDGLSLSIVSEGVTGYAYGIEARNRGTGALIINASGDVDGTARIGIFARNSNIAGTGPLSITSQGVTGGYTGIYARNDGTGALTIVAHGDVGDPAGIVPTNAGIFARSLNVLSTDLSITSQEVAGGVYGIYAVNFGTGALSVDANGHVSGAAEWGIFAFQDNPAAGPLTITSEAVTGGSYGIRAINQGSRALSITANGDVVGKDNIGIYAWSGGVDPVSGKSLSIETEAVLGGVHGIYARNYGAGALEIVANGDVEGTAATGIHAKNYGVDADGKSLSITSQAVTGGSFGIRAFNYGAGALEIVANGDVEGITGTGIFARSEAAAIGPLNITTYGNVAGALYGIAAHNDGMGALEIVANGNVVGTSYAGIYARQLNVASSASLSITSYGNVAGGNAGIRAVSHGLGATEIVAHGDVMAVTDVGIYARNLSPTPGLLSITSHGTVTGNNFGIRAVNLGTGTISVVANGDVTGNQGIVTAAGAGATVTVNSGATVSGGTSGVLLFLGANNTLNNYGTVSNLAGLSGAAILGGAGGDIVNNFGVVTGNVHLTAGANAFNNMDGGLFNSGATVFLGAGNLLTNEGTLSPGGAGNILTTELTGNFSQPGSELEVNLLGFESDLLNVSGDTDLAGKVRPLYTLNGLGAARRWTILNSGTDIVDNGIEPISTLVVQFGLDFPAPTQMDLFLAGVDFAVSGLNKNQTSIAKNLNQVFQAGNFPKLDQMITAVAMLPSEAAIANALDQLSPEIYLDTEIATLFSAANFASSLMTCPVRDGPAAFIKEGECVWARISGRDLDQSATAQSFGFDERSFEVAGGMQGALGEVWRVGFAGAYEHSKLDTTSNASSDADRIHGGAVLKYNPGALLLAGAVSGGWGWYETERQIAFPGFLALAQSDQDIGYLNGRLRAAYQLGAGTWYLKPMVDLDATHVSLDGVSETGAGGVGLKVQGANETVLSATPAVELGAQFGAAYGTLVRPYLRGGATFYDDPDFVLLASFEGAPSGVGPFRIATSTDDTIGTVGAGVDVIGAEGASFRLYYEGRFGDLVEQHAGGIKGTLPF